MSQPDTGEHTTEVLDYPFRDGGRVTAIRVDYDPGGATPGKHRHPPGAYVYVMEGSVLFGIEDQEPFLLKAGESYYEAPNALHSVSRNASADEPASLLAFFVRAGDEQPLVPEDD